MRIRLFRAFASNNSGAYVLLGRFHEVSVAEQSARELNEALEAHDAWEATLPPSKDPSPFMAFAEKHGLPMQGGWVPWERGMRCEVLGQQVLLESYAADMPSALGAWIAKHGGHIETEIIHAHGATVLRVGMHTRDGHRPENRQASVAARQRVVERLRVHPDVVETLAPRRPGDPERQLHAVPDGAPSTLVLAPRDVTRASKAIRAIAREEEVFVSFSISEWIDDHADPAAVMAGAKRTEWLDVVLVSPGPDPEALIAALVSVLKVERGYAEALVLDRPPRPGRPPTPWPRHIVRGATAGWAEQVLGVVLASGATAHLEASATRAL